MCRLLQVSTSGYYGWRDRPMSAHARKDVELTALIHQIYEVSHHTYGARPAHMELREAYGVRVGRKRVARLMRQAGLKGVQKRRFRCTTRSGEPERWAPDLVDRRFVADRPDALWVADVTYVPTSEGFLYLAVVLDVFSRLVVGWAMAYRLASHLVLAALEMAYTQRAPHDVIHHSDHGSEGGFKRSLQHSGDGGCDGYSQAKFRPFRTREVVLTWSADGWGCGTKTVLVRDCNRPPERGSGGSCWSIVTGRDPMVSGGWGYATVALKAVGAAAIGALFVVC